MKTVRGHRIGDLQLEILKVLWGREAAVAEVSEALRRRRRRPVAYTTAATMLRKMEVRGLVKHRAEGRRFIYRAAVLPEAIASGMATHVLDRVFEGRLSSMVSHLLTRREVSREELDEIERLVRARKEERS
jgi:predicted transcriptional regulator